MSKFRDFFGLQKEINDWDKQDTKIIFLSIFLYMGLAALPFIIKSEEDMGGNKITSIILLGLSIYSFIAFIVTSISINRKR